MKQVCIGIHAHEQPEQLHATLESVRANTASTVQLILLPDGPDERLRQALHALSDITQFGTEQPLGPPACFNRLAANSDASIVVLLESGAWVAPNWLEQLVAALEADPRNGLAGPSTNCAWNEQSWFPHARGTPREITCTGQEAARQFGNQYRTLEPLYSLADFCYAVRREVIDEIGAADEGYGAGPCWEMDYNIRAARAGWRGVWACAAYVHRAPRTARRQAEETRRFNASKQHYQDKFCGARLRGEKTDYRTHCRGDACPNFAPADLIEIKRPFAVAPPRSAELWDAAPYDLQVTSEPLVSCIMPTYNRRRFIPQTLRCFQRQDYANLELIVVDDGTETIADCLPADPRIRYFRLEQKLSVGAKRNFACQQARGEFIAHWDDDDWYPATRIRTQARALAESGADVCGSSRIYYYAPASEQAWEYRYAATPAWVGGNILAYRRAVWERSPFPDLQVGEDSQFVYSGKTICDLAQPQLCVALAHAGNTSYKETGGSFWHTQPVAHLQQLLGAELDLYRALFGAGDTTRWPLVSCIMPTYQRRPFISQTLRCFLDQDYPNKELIVVDDGADAVGDLLQALPGVNYLRLTARASIGAKRNLACAEARGEIIAHWDDDDWYAPDRLRYQIAPLLAGEAEITGLFNSFVLELPGGQFWGTQPELHKRMFVGDVHGGTLVYQRELLRQGLRYPELNLAEDAWLLQTALKLGKRLRQLTNPGVFVYVRHTRNAWREFAPGTFLDPAGWRHVAPPQTFPAAALSSYQSAAALNQ